MLGLGGFHHRGFFNGRFFDGGFCRGRLCHGRGFGLPPSRADRSFDGFHRGGLKIGGLRCLGLGGLGLRRLGLRCLDRAGLDWSFDLRSFSRGLGGQHSRGRCSCFLFRNTRFTLESNPLLAPL